MWSNELVITLCTIAFLRLYKVLGRIHNKGKLSNTDVAVLGLWLAASLFDTLLMRLLCIGVCTYAAAVWSCRWIVARARKEEEEEALETSDSESESEEIDEVCGYGVGPVRKGSVVVNEVDTVPTLATDPLTADDRDLVHAVADATIGTAGTTEVVEGTISAVARESEQSIIDAFGGTYTH